MSGKHGPRTSPYRQGWYAIGAGLLIWPGLIAIGVLMGSQRFGMFVLLALPVWLVFMFVTALSALPNMPNIRLHRLQGSLGRRLETVAEPAMLRLRRRPDRLIP